MKLPHKAESSKGFTLLELMIVIALLGIFLAVAVPRMGGSKTDFKLYTTARNLVSDIRYTQELSISTKEKHGIFFDGSDGKWYEIRNLVTGKTVKRINLNNGASYEKMLDTANDPVGDGIVFDSTGKPYEDDEVTALITLSTIYLKAADMYIYVRVTPQTGEVSFGRN
ncbi:MAG: Tfp pilus assembly protein FimT/FimU [Deltaproteobacteria bacterium]